MSGLVYGSLFSGYEGLTMGAQAVLPGRTAWVSDIDRGSCKLLAHRFPDVPNLGDITAIQTWLTVEPVDVLTAGFPCQPVSHAGKRLGDEDERWLWDEVVRAVRALEPRLVLLENVRGLLTARGGRLFGRVLGTLADIGYDAAWVGLRAADAGAPHNRFRVFILAYPDSPRLGGLWGIDTIGRDAHGRDRANGLRASAESPALLRTPTAQLAVNGGSQHPDKRRAGGHGPTLADEVEHLLPTPAVNDMGAGKTVEQWDEWTAKMKAAHGNGNGHGASLAIEAQRAPTSWGKYREAILHWESVTGRWAPRPVEPSPRGGMRLAPAFVEWMMGLPAGWVTDVPGLTRNDMLKLCGNGVVPQQAEAALRLLLAREQVAA